MALTLYLEVWLNEAKLVDSEVEFVGKVALYAVKGGFSSSIFTSCMSISFTGKLLSNDSKN